MFVCSPAPPPPHPQGLKRSHSGSEVQGDLAPEEPSLKRMCGPPPQLVLPDQAFLGDEPLLPPGAATATAAAAGFHMWRTGLTPRVSESQSRGHTF